MHAALSAKMFGKVIDAAGVGRYEVVRKIGEGGLGVVYAARDPELDRMVALKLVRPDRLEHEDAWTAQARLVREAQAMAKVSHHNVIHVYETGAFEDQVFLAMELVDGVSLRAWLAAKERTLEEILDVFVQAAAGLFAAHEQGLVHRDFKPDNVLVDATGRAYVVDFGLARPVRELAEAAETFPDPQNDGQRPEAPVLATLGLTETGALLGTPAYMAPEQFEATTTDARTDQFSFCVALWEACYGQRPFRGRTLVQLAEAVTSGRIEPPKRSDKAPMWLRNVLLRGLQSDARHRFGSMSELLTAVERRRYRVRRWAPVGIAATALVGSAIGFFVGADNLCGDAGQGIQAVWSTESKRALMDAFASSSSPAIRAGHPRAEAILDDYAKRWTTMATDACEATLLRGEQSHELLALRRRCLDRRKTELETLVVELSQPKGDALRYTVEAAQRLTSLDDCQNGLLLRGPASVPDDGDARKVISDIRTELDRAAVLRRLGSTDSLASTLAAARKRVDALGYRPLQAETALQEGLVLRDIGEYEPAAQALHDAVWFGEAGRHDVVAARALAVLAVTRACQLRDAESARSLVRRSEAIVERLRRPPHHLLESLRARALVAACTGDANAVNLLHQAAVRAEVVLGANDLRTLDLEHRHGVSLGEQGHRDEASELLTSVLREKEELFGHSGHPNLELTQNALEQLGR